MASDSIAEVGIDDAGRMYVRPAVASFEHIYRAAMGVNWDASTRRISGPKPRQWTYLNWFKQIVAAAANEHGISLRLAPDTDWRNVPAAVRAEIEGLAAG